MFSTVCLGAYVVGIGFQCKELYLELPLCVLKCLTVSSCTDSFRKLWHMPGMLKHLK